MASLDKHPSAYTSTTGFDGNWTNPGNAYSNDNTNYATAAPGRNAEFATNWRGFDFSAIPDGSTINSVTVHNDVKVSAAWSQGEFRGTVWADVTAAAALAPGTTGSIGNTQYTQSTAAWPTSDTDWSYALTTLPTVAQLKGTNFGVRFEVSKGNNGTTYTTSLDDIYINVDYTAPAPNAHGQSQTQIKSTARVYGQAQVQIKTVQTYPYSKSITDVFRCGAECDLAHWTSSGGSTTVDTGIKHNGNASIKVAAAGAATYRVWTTTTVNPWIVRFSIYLDGLPTANAQLILLTRATTGDVGVIYDQASGKLGLMEENYAASTVLGPVIANQTWANIDLHIDGTAQTVQWKVNGIAQTSLTLNYSGTWASCYIGQQANYGGFPAYTTYTAYYDDLAISNTATDYPIDDGYVIAGETWVSDIGRTYAQAQAKIIIISTVYGQAQVQITSSASLYASLIMADTPVGYWRMGAASGTVYDETDNNLDLTASGTPTYGETGALTGDSDLAMQFDASDRVSRTTGGVTLTAPYSVEMWAKKTAATTSYYLVNLSTASQGAHPNFGPFHYGTSYQRPIIYLNTSNYRYFDYGSGFADGNWHHCVFIVTGTAASDILTAVCYIDGKSITASTTTSTDTPIAPTGNIQIGVGSGDPSYIDEVAVYDYALTQLQSANHYLMGKYKQQVVIGQAQVQIGITAYRAYGQAQTQIAGVYRSLYAEKVLENSPKAYWRFGESSGYPQDSSGNSHPATTGANVTQGATGALDDDTDTANTFNGTSSYWGIPDHADLDLGDVHSVELWFTTTVSASNNAFSKGAGAYFGGIESSKFTCSNVVESSNNVNDGVWHHMVHTKNGTARLIYIDGIDVTVTRTNIVETDNTNTFYIGRNQAGSVWWNGGLDEFALYSTVLTPLEIANHYLMGKYKQQVVVAQAQVQITAVSVAQSYAQAQALIKTTYESYAQAEVQITGGITTIYRTANIKTNIGFHLQVSNAQARIYSFNYPKYAQAQTVVYGQWYMPGLARCSIDRTPKTGNAAALIDYHGTSTSDSFTRYVPFGWGSADVGGEWWGGVVSSNGPNEWAIGDTRGIVRYSGTSYAGGYVRISPKFASSGKISEINFKVKLTPGSHYVNRYGSIYVSSQYEYMSSNTTAIGSILHFYGGSPNYIKLDVSTTSSSLNPSTPIDLPLDWNANKWYRFKMQSINTEVITAGSPYNGTFVSRIKVWEDGTSEPNGWQLEYRPQVAIQATPGFATGGQKSPYGSPFLYIVNYPNSVFEIDDFTSELIGWTEYAQAQAQIKITYQAWAQGNALIKVTSSTYAQVQADIKQAYNAYAQAQTLIVVKFINVYAQSMAQIKTTYRGYAQAQSQIKQVYRGYAQALATVKQVYRVYAQAQAQIKQTYRGYAQAQTQIKQVYKVYANVLTQVKTTYRVYAQSLAQIKTTYRGYAQAQSNIKQIYTVYSQANVWIKVIGINVYAQAQAGIKAQTLAYAQAQVQLLGAKVTYNTYAQAQAKIFPPTILIQTVNSALSVAGYIYLNQAPTVGNLLVLYAWVRGSTDPGIPSGFTTRFSRTSADPYLYIATRVVQSGDGTDWYSSPGGTVSRRFVIQEWSGIHEPTSFVDGSLDNTDPTNIVAGTGMALGLYSVYTDLDRLVHVILPSIMDYENYADNSGYGPYGSVGHSPLSLNIQATSAAIQYQVDWYVVGNYPTELNVVCGQAQTHIKVSAINVFGQAQATIESTYQVYGQAEVFIYKPVTSGMAYAQALAQIKQLYLVYGQALATIEQTYRGYAQAQAQIIISDIQAYGQAQTQIKQSYQVYAQGNTQIKTIYRVYAQAQGQIKLVKLNTALAAVFINGDYSSVIDSFNRTLTDNWGTADTGGTYTIYGGNNARFDVNGSVGTYIKTPNTYDRVYLSRVLINNSESIIKLTLPRPSSGSYGLYIETHCGSPISNTLYNGYNLNVSTNSAGSISLFLRNKGSNIDSVATGITLGIGSTLLVKLKTYQTSSSVRLFAKVWVSGDTEPSWQVSGDSSTPLPPGFVGIVFPDEMMDFSSKTVTLDDWNIYEAYLESYAQAQTNIKATYQNYAQAQTAILANYLSYAQAIADIKQTYVGYAQAQVQIRATYWVWAQGNVLIVASYQAYANAQVIIEAVYNAYAQAQAKINSYDVQVYGQAVAYIAGQTVAYAQAQAQIKVTSQVFGQAQGQIKQEYQVFAQAQAQIKQVYLIFAQTQTNIKQVYQVYAQAQTSIKQVYQSCAQALAQIQQAYKAYAQVEVWIEAIYQAYAQGQTLIRAEYQGYAQALTLIVVRDIEEFAQAGATIFAIESAYGQAEVEIYIPQYARPISDISNDGWVRTVRD